MPGDPMLPKRNIGQIMTFTDVPDSIDYVAANFPSVLTFHSRRFERTRNNSFWYSAHHSERSCDARDTRIDI
jgi:hypothetical protein